MPTMNLAVTLLVLALLFGLLGLVVETTTWAFLVALVLLIAGAAVASYSGRGRTRV